MIYVVKSIFNSDITNGLYDGFQEAINEDGYDKEIKLIVVPGAFDIPGAVSTIINNENCEIVTTLGCVIKGETDHYHYICDAVANGIMNLTLKSVTPILFGVLTFYYSIILIARPGVYGASASSSICSNLSKSSFTNVFNLSRIGANSSLAIS